MNYPQHILDKAKNDPRVTLMDWKFEQTLPPLVAETVTAYIKVIQGEFVKLLHTNKETDEVYREWLVGHKPFMDFKTRYPTIFKKITTREFALSPPLMSLVLYEVYILEQVQNGKLTEAEAQQKIAKSALECMIAHANKT